MKHLNTSVSCESSAHSDPNLVNRPPASVLDRCSTDAPPPDREENYPITIYIYVPGLSALAR